MSVEIQHYALPSDSTDKLLAYPYSQPEVDYLSDGEALFELPERNGDFRNAADKLLQQKGLPLMADRIPLISYGANANPLRFAEKMAKFENNSTHDMLQMTPFQRATVVGADIVWHGKQGQSGGIFAELYNGPLLKNGAEAPVFLSWVTPQQLAILHTSEGITYRLSEVVAKAGSDKQALTAYAYTAGVSSVLIKGGEPISVSRPQVETPGSMSARQALSYLLAEVHASDSPEVLAADTPEELVHEMKSKPNLVAKKETQRAVQAALTSRGASASFTYQIPEAGRIGRADFNFVKGYHELHLLEEVIGPLGSTDLTTAVRRRAHNEIQERLANPN